MPEHDSPPLKIGTPVEVNIAQGAALATGVVTAADYDDAWMYRISVSSGDDCRAHYNEAGELWVCDFEVCPTDDTTP